MIWRKQIWSIEKLGDLENSNWVERKFRIIQKVSYNIQYYYKILQNISILETWSKISKEKEEIIMLELKHNINKIYAQCKLK